MKKTSFNQNGQVTIEAILLMVIMTAVFTFAHKRISQEEWLSKLVAGPWSYVQGMISNGVWKGGNSNNYHPNQFLRRASPRTD